MCGRYYIEENRRYQELLEQAEADPRHQEKARKAVTRGEVSPGNWVLCVGLGHKGIRPGFLQWGYPGFDQKKLINTRVETVNQKPLFKDNFQRFRCAIPASGFFEWDRAHNPFFVRDPDHPLFYLAGLYDLKTTGFSILTRSSYGQLSTIHDRAPVLLDEQEIADYLTARMPYQTLAGRSAHLSMQPYHKEDQQ